MDFVNALVRTMVQLASQGVFERNQICMALVLLNMRHSKQKKNRRKKFVNYAFGYGTQYIISTNFC